MRSSMPYVQSKCQLRLSLFQQIISLCFAMQLFLTVDNLICLEDYIDDCKYHPTYYVANYLQQPPIN